MYEENQLPLTARNANQPNKSIYALPNPTNNQPDWSANYSHFVRLSASAFNVFC